MTMPNRDNKLFLVFFNFDGALWTSTHSSYLEAADKAYRKNGLVKMVSFSDEEMKALELMSQEATQ